jgi:hypothetical protein
MKTKRADKSVRSVRGKLRIGDHWNAITIIALSQTSPLKAVAEFVENAIDAHAKNITITRGKERGQQYLRIVDDGDGVPRDENGLPDFKFVATHICDSIKRRMKEQGARELQGEFGIGLLSFWTVGEELSLTSRAADGRTLQMHMRKGDPDYAVRQTARLFETYGTELKIWPLLPGIRQFSGEKIQWYLASELRDRIRNSGVQIRIVDHSARAEMKVEPRQFTGRLLHQLPRPVSREGEVYVELYLDEPGPQNQVSLYRAGTRVLERITELEAFARAPWNSGHVQGIIDAPFLNLTPGTRLGIVQDHAYAALCESLEPLRQSVAEIVDQQRKAEEERTSRDTLRSIQKALREALLSLPDEEYDWFNVRDGGNGNLARRPPGSAAAQVADGNAPTGRIEQESDSSPEKALSTGESHAKSDETGQKEFYQFAGPLFSVRIYPASSVVAVHSSRTLRAVARDRERRAIDSPLTFRWEIIDGPGHIENPDAQIITFHSGSEPGLANLRVSAIQEQAICSADALVTVTASLLPKKPADGEQRGIPGYTYQKAPGELWRSRYRADQNVIVINNGHRDFVYASRNKSLKLRYLCRLFAKELVFRNFPGYGPEQLLERLIELSLYTEENLR